MSFKDYKIGRLLQGTFGTPPGAADAVRHLNCEPVGISAMVNVREHNVADARRHLDEKDFAVDTNEIAPELTITGIAEKLELPFLLYLFFQNVTEGVDPFPKTFEFPTTQPDFQGAAGYFCSFLMQSQTASQSHLMIDCICKELKLSCAPGERMKYSATFISRGAIDSDFNPSGTWTRNAGTFYHYSDIDVHTIDTVAHILTGGWELTLTQDVKPYGTDGSGSFYSYMIDNRRGIFNTTILTNTEGYAIEGDMEGGAFVDLRMGYGNATPGTDDGDLDIAMHGLFSKVEQNVESPAGLNIEMIMAGDTTSTEPITIIVADGEDQTW